jgi:hypothetical protein
MILIVTIIVLFSTILPTVIGDDPPDEPKQYTLSVTIRGNKFNGGTINGGGRVQINPDQEKYDEGTIVALSAIPIEGWYFSHWDGSGYGSEITILITMNNHKSVTAVFNESINLAYSPEGFSEFILKERVTTTYFDVWNSGESDYGPLRYNFTEDCEWISVSPQSGFSHGEHDRITVEIDPWNLSVGRYYSYDISINTNANSGTFPVEVYVVEEGDPLIDTGKASFNDIYIIEDEVRHFNFNVYNGGKGVLEFEIEEDCDWIQELNPVSGILGQNQSELIYFEINATDLPVGQYSTTIDVVADGAADVFIPVSVNVTEKQRLSISMTKFSFNVLGAQVTNVDTEPLYNIELELFTEYGFLTKENASAKEILRLEPGETGFVEIRDLKSLGFISANATASIPGFTPVSIGRSGFIIGRLILLIL